MRLLFSFLLLLIMGSVCAQDYSQLATTRASGEIAYDITAYVEQFWRLAGNPGFDSSINHIVKHLESAGFQLESSATGSLIYRIEERPLERPAWYPVDASLSLDGANSALLTYKTNHNMVAVNSYPTTPEGITAEVVKIDRLEDLSNRSVKGKIVYGKMHPFILYRAAVGDFGAAGVLTYEMPGYLKPEINQRSIQFRSIPYSDTLKGWSVSLSYAAMQALDSSLENGRQKFHVKIDSRFVDAPERTIIARVLGSQMPDEEVVISAHVQEPGANDNASGTGAATEMAVILADLYASNSYKPDRTITFLWGDEIASTKRYVEEHGKKINWGFSLDMVGENTAITGGSFLIEKMPDPSAVWTRGTDKHTEWGGSPITPDRLQPHYLNDFVINRFSRLGEKEGWEVNTNPYEGGSDHVPFLRGDIPAVLFWHFTDQFYHTDQDRLDKVSRETLRNVVSGTLTSVMTLANGHESLALQILEEIALAAKTRIYTESVLSKEVVDAGENADEQAEIISTWTSYYRDVAATVTDLSKSADVRNAINTTRLTIAEYGEAALDALE